MDQLKQQRQKNIHKLKLNPDLRDILIEIDKVSRIDVRSS